MPNLPEIETLSLRSQVAQMLVVRASGHLYDHQIQYPQWEHPLQQLQNLVTDYGVGGVILVGGSAPEIYLRSQQLQAWADIPLLIAADVEEGVGQRFDGATHFPPPMALSALPNAEGIKYAEQMGRITAIESTAIGINWLLAPVVDINNNPANPVINVRAFGETLAQVTALSTAFIRGASDFPVLTTAKHFPGHGDTAVDSHLDTPVLTHTRDRFLELELPPFAAAIATGVDTVMSAHVFAPNLDSTTIATLSHPILTTLLREQMGFAGLIVTDALIMAGVADRHSTAEVAIKAIQAGADILLMPTNAIATIDAIVQAVESGEISRDRIKASVTRIWQAKAKVGKPTLDLTAIGQDQSIATEITAQSLKVHQPQPITIPPHTTPTNLILVDNLLTCGEFLTERAAAIAIPQALGYARLILDIHNLQADISQQVSQLSPTLVQIFSRGNPFRGSAGMYQQIEILIKELVHQEKLLAIALYGSPYNCDRLTPLLPSAIPWVFSYNQQPIAQKLLLQRLFAHPQIGRAHV